MSRAERTGLDPEWIAERRSEGRLEVDLRVPEQLDVWPGHFPGHFVVPGVLQIDWVIRIAVSQFGVGVPSGIENLKFKSPLLPRQQFTLVLERGRRPREIEFRLAHGTSVFAAGRLEIEGDLA